MRQLLTVFLLTIPFTLFGQRDSVNIWISKIDNRSIAGTCNYAWVIKPTISEVDKIIKTGKNSERKLLKLLTSEEKGVIAHYILSNIYKQTNYQTLAMDTVKLEICYIYNGLEFTETATGMVTDKVKLDRCKADWIKKFRE